MKRRPFWIYILLFLAAQASGVLFASSGPVLMLLFVNIIAIVLYLLATWGTRPDRAYKAYKAHRDYKAYGSHGSHGSYMTLSLLLLALAPPCIFLVNYAQEMLPSLPDIVPEQSLTELLTTPLGLLTVCILGPLSEELLFRAGVLGSLLQRCRPWTAIAWSAVIFALIHANPAQMPAAFFLGLLLGYAYYSTHSILTPLFIHIFNNSIAAAWPDTSFTDALTTPWHHIAAVTIAIVWAVLVIICVARLRNDA